jgi:hypothetical protein
MINLSNLYSNTKEKIILFFSLIIRAFSQNRVFAKIVFVITGIGATIWFLSRVIPKPSRATYPCMQAAAPVMASFVVYLISITSSVIVFKKIHTSLFEKKYVLALTLVLVLAVLTGISIISNSPSVSAVSYASQDDFAPNQPMGIAHGVNPGRVVWVWDPESVNQNCQQTVNKNGLLDSGDDLWFMDKNTNQDFVDYMLSRSVQDLTGENTDKQAWDALFRYFNQKKGKETIGYKEGEIVFIKTNHGSAWGTDRYDSQFRFNDKAWNAGYTETGPHLVLSVLRHLVNRVGVPQHLIYVGDPMKNIYKEFYQKWHAEFPNVKYLGNNLIVNNVPNLATYGRTPVVRTSTDVIYYSDDSDISESTHNKKLYTIFEEADYLINLTALKPHEVGGITAPAKNHFGSQAAKNAMHLHGVLTVNRPDYKTYRVLVDLMGHRLLGRNTLLHVVDVMWSSENMELSLPVKWTMFPFSGNYPSSLIVSQDQVAIESVCFDFLRTEYTVGDYDKNNPNMAGTDDYMHQAADEANWPVGVIYNPDGTGKMGSLGVHEHWNNPTDMKYSRNLGTGNGIELVKVWVENNRIPLAVKPISDKVLSSTGVDLVAVDDVQTYFYDADGDVLSFTAENSDARLSARVESNKLIVNLSEKLSAEELISVTLTASDGKASKSLSFNVKSDPSTGVIIFPQHEVKVFPNPVRETLNLKFNRPGSYRMYIYNNLGQMEQLQAFDGDEHSVDFSGMTKGLFHVLVTDGNQTIYSGGVVKE